MPKILVIDDEAPIRSMLKEILEDEGYEVVEAENGEVGLNQYRNEPTDLVITDIVMPDKEGIATIRELKQEFPDVKIIAMSGGGRSGADDYLMMAKAFGVKHIFKKPVSYSELIEAVSEAVSELV